MVVDGVDPWLPDQRAQTLHKGLRRKQQGARAVGPRTLQRQQDLAVAALLEAIERQRWPSNIATKPLQSSALVPANPQTRMKVKASIHRATLGKRGRRLAEHVELSEPCDALTGSLTEEGAPRDGCPVEGMLLRVGAQAFFEQPTPIQETMHAASDLEDDALNILGRRLDGDKVRRVPRTSSDKDTIGDQDVEVDVEVQRAAEALNRGDGPTLGRTKTAPLGRSPEVTEDGPQDEREDGLAQRIVPREPEPERDGKGEHPLANRSAGQDALPPPQRPLRHPTAAAAGTEAATLAREADDAVEAAGGAGGAVEAK